MHDTSPEVSVPTATTVLRQGFRRGDRVLRTAMVAVTDPESPAPQPEAQPARRRIRRAGAAGRRPGRRLTGARHETERGRPMSTRDFIEKDYYAALGVPKDADAAAIKKAYRQLARDLHPDKNPGNDAAETRFKEVSEAYDVLSDPKRRGEYDEARRLFGAGGRPGGFPGGFPGAGGGQPFDLGDLFGGGGAGRARRVAWATCSAVSSEAPGRRRRAAAARRRPAPPAVRTSRPRRRSPSRRPSSG